MSRICAVIPEQLDSLENEYDCDEAEINVLPAPVPSTSAVAPSGVNEHLEICSSGPCHNPENQVDGPTPTEPQQKATRKRDARSLLVDYEPEEHSIRLKNGKIQIKILELELKMKERQLIFLEEEHELKTRVLEKQLESVQNNFNLCWVANYFSIADK